MCSFDVSSLFRNVTLDETIQICLDKLYTLPDGPTLPRPVLKVCFSVHKKKSHFIFDGQYYDQIDGVATGSPVLICHSEEKSALSDNTRPSIWFRYADDTFILFDNNNATNQILHYLNSCHANINNTMISFLNILIKRSNRAFSTPIYRKTTHSALQIWYLFPSRYLTYL